MKIVPVVASLVLAAALVVSGGAAWLLLRDARASAAADVSAALAMTSAALRAGTPNALGALEPLTTIESAKLYGADGRLVAQFARPPRQVPFQTVAARLVPPDVACSTVISGSLCIESSSAAIAPRVRGAILLIAVSALVATLLGWLAGRALAGSVTLPLRRMADVVDKAAREGAYSLRVDASGGGDHARIASSINELLSQIQERDVALRRRTTEVEAANKDLESFAYSVSHDLRAPLGSIDGFTYALQLDYAGALDDTGREYLGWIRQAATQMRDLIDGLLQMTRLSRAELQREAVDLSSIAHNVADSLRQSEPERPVQFAIRDGVRAVGDARLLRSVLENLMSNAWKFTRKREDARIEFGVAGGAFYVRDNGAGFDPSHAAKMFRPFQRLHSSREFEGTGIGLATVQKIIERHGGRAWAEGEVDKGATIYFTTGAAAEELVQA